MITQPTSPPPGKEFPKGAYSLTLPRREQNSRCLPSLICIISKRFKKKMLSFANVPRADLLRRSSNRISYWTNLSGTPRDGHPFLTGLSSSSDKGGGRFPFPLWIAIAKRRGPSPPLLSFKFFPLSNNPSLYVPGRDLELLSFLSLP